MHRICPNRTHELVNSCARKYWVAMGQWREVEFMSWMFFFYLIYFLARAYITYSKYFNKIKEGTSTHILKLELDKCFCPESPKTIFLNKWQSWDFNISLFNSKNWILSSFKVNSQSFLEMDNIACLTYCSGDIPAFSSIISPLV